MLRPSREGSSRLHVASAATLGVGHLAGDVSSRVSVGDVAAPVVELLAAGKTQLQLRPALAGQIEAKRHDRQALRLRLAEKLVDLVTMEKQLRIRFGSWL